VTVLRAPRLSLLCIMRRMISRPTSRRTPPCPCALLVFALSALGVAACGGAQDGSTTAPGIATATPVTAAPAVSGSADAGAPLSHAQSCEEVDHVFQLESRSGTGSVSPMYGFGAVDRPEPTEDEAIAHLRSVLLEFEQIRSHLAPSVRAKSAPIAAALAAQRAAREKRIEDLKKEEEAARKEEEEAIKRGEDPVVARRRRALRDAAHFGMMGLLGDEDEIGPSRDRFFDAYLAFFDECAADLGISEKAQAAHRVLFPRKSQGGEPR
jgi:hypothetical protein